MTKFRSVSDVTRPLRLKIYWIVRYIFDRNKKILPKTLWVTEVGFCADTIYMPDILVKQIVRPSSYVKAVVVIYFTFNK